MSDLKVKPITLEMLEKEVQKLKESILKKISSIVFIETEIKLKKERLAINKGDLFETKKELTKKLKEIKNFIHLPIIKKVR